jgi:NAD(P)-dependent dehydrogenase (short-subunit alcohol dehydrogenase family)
MSVVVISGASSGIGLAATRIFAENGHTVYGISRRGKGYEGAIQLTADITHEESVKAAFESVIAKEGRIDVLVNNAGCGISGAVECVDTKEAERLFDVNFFGALRCIKYAVPAMNSGSRIVNISSAAAIFSIPFQAFYSASKSAVNSLTLALANELRPFGIEVCAVMPGDVKTGFTEARVKSDKGSDKYGKTIEKSVSMMEKDEENGIRPEDMAAYIYKIAVKKHVKPLYAGGMKYKVFAFLSKVLPVSVINYIVGMMYCPK